MKATGAELRLPFYYGLLAEVCGLAGQMGEALANVSSGFAFQSKNGEMWSGAGTAPDPWRFAPAQRRCHLKLEVSYRRAIESARQTGARMFELRAAARLQRAARRFKAARRTAAER